MNEKKVLNKDVAPVFASDYVNHSPAEFSLTNMLKQNGERTLAFSFIDHLVIPSVEVDDKGNQNHSVSLERRYRSTVIIPEELWNQMVAIAAALKKEEN